MANICPSAQLEVNVPELLNFLIENEVYRDDYENVIARILEEDVNYETAIKAVTANAEHIANRGVNINTVALGIVFCKYCSHRILSPYRQSIISYKNQKHFNQFTMSLLFCVILFYIIFLVSAAASVGTEQMSTGHLVVFASLRSVQSGHPPDVLHPCIFPSQSS